MKTWIAIFALAGLASIAGAVDFSQDPSGRLLSEQYTNGAAVAYAYDAAGNLVRLQTASSSNATPADVAVSVSTAPAAPAAGETFTTTLVVTNAGPGTAYGVAVTWTHPAALAVEALGLSQGSAAPTATAVVFSFGAVASGAVAVAEMVARYPAQGSATSVFTAATLSPDPALANNSATQVLAIAAGADLVLSAAAFPDVVCSGLPLTYFIAVSNAGPNAAAGVVASNALSGAFALDSVVMSQGTSSSAGQTVALNFGALAVGAVATAEVWLRPAQTNGGLTNVCTGAATQGDPNPADNLATIVSPVRLADFIVTTANDDGAGSLRSALTGTASYIAFDIPGTNVPTIGLLSPLPSLSNRTVDGFSQWARRVELNGAGVTNADADGLRIRDPGNTTLRGLVINRFPRDGIRIASVTSTVSLVNFVVEGCRIGTDSTGTLPGYGNGSNGVVVVNPQAGRIGGPAAWQGNLISGNGAAGIQLLSAGTKAAVDTTLQGNRIGTDIAGTGPLPNGTHGVHYQLTFGSTDDIFLKDNLISGNGAYGVYIAGRNCIVHGNRIGTDILGMSAIANASGGVFLASASSGTYNQIGGSGAGEGNLISGNGGHGVESRRGSGETAYDWIAGNRIGTDLGGCAALPNQGDGVRLVRGTYAQIGDVAAGGANVIAGNTGHGVNAISGQYRNVWGNWIGIGADGATVVPNQGSGVNLVAPTDCEVGGSFLDRRNVIAGNLGHGVALSAMHLAAYASTSVEGNWIGLAGDGTLEAGNGGAGIAVLLGTGFRISANAIQANAGLGIDLNTNGVTANDAAPDADSGPNDLMNYPVITNVASGAGSTVVQGTLSSRSNTTARIEFFRSPSVDPTGYGEGAAYLGAVDVALGAGGADGFEAVLPGNLPAGTYVTAVSTINGTSSEFSAALFYSPGDSDGDGIPDDWENRWDLGLGAFSRTNDWDLDGDTDWSEYVADTCPTNGERLAIHAVSAATNNLQVTFGSSTARVYTLQSRTNLTAGNWAGVSGQANRAGESDGQTTLTDTTAVTVRMYRIQVAVP